jgi:signal transduction histidine kinase
MNAPEPRPRVLIVDDELGVRESLRAILQTDCEILTASSGEQALDTISREPVDVMTLDLKMPGLGGMRVLEQAKKIDPDLEVLIITGYGSFDTAVEGLRYHALDYLSKPFDCDQVRRLIEKAWARRAEARRVKTVPEHLLATLSHGMRNPLNAIVGYSTMLQEEIASSLSDDNRQALEKIQSNSASFLGYVETLFYLSELNAGLHPLRPSAVRVTDVLARLALEQAAPAQAKGVIVRVESPADLVFRTDEDKLARLVRALADNAVKFTPAGKVTLTAAAAPGGLRLEVRDTGPGLDGEMVAETLIEASAEAAQRPTRLLGFGLRLVGRLVRALEGTIDVATAANGTVYRVTLPALA